MPDQFLDELPLGIWIAKAPGGELEYANAAFAEIMGMSARGDVAAGGYSGPYGICDREGKPFPESRLPFVRVLETRETVIVDDIVIHRRDGRTVDIRAYGKPVFDGDELTHVIVAFTDMTAEVAATRAKEVAQSRLRTAVEHAPVVLFVYDRDGTITLAEGGPLSRLSLPPGGLVGRCVYDVYREVPAIVQSARRVLEGGETFTHSVSVDGVEFETWLAPIRGPEGVITGAIGVATDVTERAQMQRKFLQTDRLVSLGTLAAGVAHELNNPLTYVTESLAGIDDLVVLLNEDLDRIGQLSYVEKRLQLLQQCAAHAREGAERLRVITRDLRSFSRVDDARHVFDVRVAVQSALHLVTRTLQEHARLTTDLASTPRVYANEARLVQVVVNLAVNAAQAIPAGSPANANEIRVATREENGHVLIEVADTGPGVPESIRQQLFDPFFTTKDVEGTGLGLFVSRNIVEALGGTITVGDRPGGGAVFVVSLPPAPAELLAAEGAAPAASRRIVRATRPQVLVIEDDPTLGELMRGALLAECEVRVVRTAAEGAARALEQLWDLVLCDLMLGDGGTAMEVYEAVRSGEPGLEASLVFMTGGAYTAAATKFLASVPNDRLEKPFDVLDEVRRRLG